MKTTYHPLIALLTLMALMMGLSGCSSPFSTSKSSPATGSAQPARPGPAKTTAVYYDFEDVLIPLEFQIVQEKTVIVSTPGFTSGILALKGRVERRSLVDFFNNNMQKDNWTIVSQIKSPGNSILVYEKTARTAVITIKSDQFSTLVEIGVAARVTQGDLPQTGGALLIESDITQ